MPDVELHNRTEPTDGVLMAPRPAHLWIAWALVLPLLLLLLGSATTSRTQEARVLETAREMVEGISPWLAPHCSGELRLQKPPLSYWMTAGAFEIGGVSEWAGRMPAALIMWLTIGLCGHIAATLFGRRTGLLAIMMLTATYGAFRYGRLAETDTIAMLGVTLGVWGFWRASEVKTYRGVLLWNWAAAVGISIAAMGKGPPALFAVLFLVVWSIVNRSGRGLRTFVSSGGLVLALALSASWYVYIGMAYGLETVRRELTVVLSGSNHPAPVYFYLYSVLIIVGPWSAVLVSGVWESVLRAKHDRRLFGVLVWLGCCMAPLSLTGNKQLHYAMVLLPGCVLLTAWVVDQCLTVGVSRRISVWVPRLLLITAGVSVALAGAVPLTRIVLGQRIGPWDYALAAVGVSAFAAGLVLMWKRRTLMAGVTAYSLGIALLFSAVFGPWGRSLAGAEPGVVARQVRQVYGEGPYLMFNGRPDLPIVFGMRTMAKASTDPLEIKAWMQQNPGGVVLLVAGEGRKDAGLPSWLKPERKFGWGENCVWRLVDGETQPTSTQANPEQSADGSATTSDIRY